jgi:hypothetical protein
VNTGNASTNYARFVAGRNILVGQGHQFWPEPLVGQHDQNARRYYVQVNAISTNAESAGLSWQSAPVTTGTDEQPALGFPQAQGYLPTIQQTFQTTFPTSPGYSLAGDRLSIAITWERGPSAFSQIDEDRERRASNEAKNARTALPAEFGERVSNRLHQLIATARDEGLETAGPSPDSVRAAVAFLAAIASDLPARVPSLTLDAHGLVVCEWRNSFGESSVLRFLVDGSIVCALTTRSPGRIAPNTWFGNVAAEELRRQILDSTALTRLLAR